MIVEVTLSEEEVNELLEQSIQEKIGLCDDMKLVETRSYSGIYIFSDENNKRECDE